MCCLKQLLIIKINENKFSAKFTTIRKTNKLFKKINCLQKFSECLIRKRDNVK